MKDQNNNPVAFQHKRRLQDKEITLQYIVDQIESGTGLKLKHLQNQYPQAKLFFIGLRHISKHQSYEYHTNKC